MSILLDALKRSESQRELGSVPTLQTSTDSLSLDAEQAPGWVSVVMVLLAAGSMSWFGLQQFELPDEVLAPTLAQQPADPTPADGSDSPAEAESISPPVTEKSVLPVFTGATVLNSDKANAEKAKAEAQAGAGREVRNYTASEQASSEPTRDNAVRQTEMTSVEIAARAGVEMTAAQQLSGAGSKMAADDYEPDIISYWQVPESMREGLPDLRISVLVFAEQSENRFLLLNGERLREGDELPNGLLLEEIRRDRAIFNYRNYRFYLKS